MASDRATGETASRSMRAASQTISVVATIMSLLFGSGALAGVIYVDDSAPAGGNGQSWATAYRYLQDGLAAATTGDEIRIGQGTYRPDRADTIAIIVGSRNASFVIKNGVQLLGGFAGLGSPKPDTRDPSAFPSALSGDLAGNDLPDFSNMNENSVHVVRSTNNDETAVIDGCVLRGGNANVSFPFVEDRWGGGMLILGGRPHIAHCVFVANKADRGAGLGSWDADPLIEWCSFQAGHPSSFPVGMHLIRSNASIVDCEFVGLTNPNTNGMGALWAEY